MMGVAGMKQMQVSGGGSGMMTMGSPQLGLEKINMKKNKFIFARHELRPQDDDDLSRELEKEKKDTYHRQNKIKHSKGGKITISSNQVNIIDFFLFFLL